MKVCRKKKDTVQKKIFAINPRPRGLFSTPVKNQHSLVPHCILGLNIYEHLDLDRREQDALLFKPQITFVQWFSEHLLTKTTTKLRSYTANVYRALQGLPTTYIGFLCDSYSPFPQIVQGKPADTRNALCPQFSWSKNFQRT